MIHGLLDILTNKYADEQLIGSVHNEQELFLSLRSHLTRLLNTRQGSISHMPDYGLPDISSLYQGLPQSLEEFSKTVKACIEKYEPRLTAVKVFYKTVENRECIVKLEIQGSIKQSEVVHYTTFFLSGGVARIEEKRL